MKKVAIILMMILLWNPVYSAEYVPSPFCTINKHPDSLCSYFGILINMKGKSCYKILDISVLSPQQNNIDTSVNVVCEYASFDNKVVSYNVSTFKDSDGYLVNEAPIQPSIPILSNLFSKEKPKKEVIEQKKEPFKKNGKHSYCNDQGGDQSLCTTVASMIIDQDKQCDDITTYAKNGTPGNKNLTAIVEANCRNNGKIMKYKISFYKPTDSKPAGYKVYNFD